MNIVLDSSVLVGLLVPNDVWHKPAVDVWEAIKTAQQEIFDADFDNIPWLRRVAAPQDVVSLQL